MIKRLNNIGDTLIEVLIATALVSSILGGAYATSSRSLRATRQAEERVEALKYTESQVEKLRIAAGTSPGTCIAGDNNDIFCTSAPTNFCMAPTGGRVNFTLGVPPTVASNDNFSSYPSGSGGCQYSTGSVTYYLWIEKISPTPTSSTFTVHARWPSFGSTVTDEVTISYRLSR